MPKVLRPQIDGANRKVAIAVSRFNEKVTSLLLEGALCCLAERGCDPDRTTVVWVPGAFELPLACRWLLEDAETEAVIALGAVIRGETSHYDVVCAEAARGILDASTASGRPISLGLLTCDTAEQAYARAGRGHGDNRDKGNKGADAALAALEMIAVRKALSDAHPAKH